MAKISIETKEVKMNQNETQTQDQVKQKSKFMKTNSLRVIVVMFLTCIISWIALAVGWRLPVANWTVITIELFILVMYAIKIALLFGICNKNYKNTPESHVTIMVFLCILSGGTTGVVATMQPFHGWFMFISFTYTAIWGALFVVGACSSIYKWAFSAEV